VTQSSTKNKMKRLPTDFTFILFSLLFFLTVRASGQDSPQSHYRALSCPEKWWVIFHPFIAKKTYRLSIQAREVSKELLKDSFFDGDENGGQIDAFRHSYWMALLSQNICWRKARSLGKAHEKGNYLAFKKGQKEEDLLPDSLSSVMDLYNNGVGLEIGKSTKKISDEELRRVVRDSVLAGKMKVIRKNAAGITLDCDGNAMDSVRYKGKWNIPKCLVTSDTKRK